MQQPVPVEIIGQQSSPDSRPLRLSVVKAVMAYEHEDLVLRLQYKNDLAPEQAKTLFNDMKQFLSICGMVPGKWGPPPAIDTAWHEFMLFSKDYTEFCLRFFGRYIHHEPNRPGTPVDRARPKRTLVAAIKIFGKDNLTSNWEYPTLNGFSALGPHFDFGDAGIDTCGDSCGCSPCGDA